MFGFGKKSNENFVLDNDGYVLGTVVDGQIGDKWITWRTPDGDQFSQKSSALIIQWNDSGNKSNGSSRSNADHSESGHAKSSRGSHDHHAARSSWDEHIEMSRPGGINFEGCGEYGAESGDNIYSSD